MALVLADRVKETTTTAGTGTVTLLGAATGFQSFAVIGNANTTYYTIAGQNTSEWEVGIGTYTLSGTTLARTTVLANSAGTQPTALTFSAGTKDVFVTYPSSKSVNQDASGNVGIGTTSPADKLHVAISSGTLGGIRVQNTNSGGQAALSYYNDAATQKADIWWNNSGSILYFRTLSTDPMVFSTNNAERMRITSTGGVSFGATGTAYGTSGQVLTSAGNAPPTWTTATSANTASAIVQRDASGNFTAGTITAALTGTASGNLVSGGALGTPSSGTLTNCTFPTLNQNTSGTAAGLSVTLVATSGGTGQSSYAVGDLVYASTTTALSKLADVATGNALISGGVGVAPSYGKIGLTTHVSGTLPVANGGTGTTTLTANNVLLGNGASAPQFVAPGTTGNVLTSNGTTWTSAAASGFASATLMLFQQTAAPTGWTKQTTHDNKALRVVTGSASSGGTTGFSTVFTNQTPTITTGGLSAGATTLTTAQIPSHTHTYNKGGPGPGGFAFGGNAATAQTSGSTGGGGSHDHTISGSATSSAITLNVQYVDLIIASKD
jgi:hypothetical protein